METKIYTRIETAKKFKVTAATLRNWERNGCIEAPSRIGRRVYFTEDQINRILNLSKFN